jgi:hypothetical protein
MKVDAGLKGEAAPEAARHHKATAGDTFDDPDDADQDAAVSMPGRGGAARRQSFSATHPHNVHAHAGPPADAGHHHSLMHSLTNTLFRGSFAHGAHAGHDKKFDSIGGSFATSAHSSLFTELGDEDVDRPLNVVAGTAFWRRLSAGIEIICIGEMRGALLAHSALGCPGVSTLLGNLCSTMDETHHVLSKVGGPVGFCCMRWVFSWQRLRKAAAASFKAAASCKTDA